MARTVRCDRRRTLSIGQWWFVTFTILVTLPVVLAFASSNQIYAWYLQEFVEPALERDLGFQGGAVAVVENGRQYEWYGILSVSPGGEFDRAGIRSGDIPVGYQHGARSGFISDLSNGRGSNVTLTFITRAPNAIPRGTRRVTVRVPPSAG